MAGWGAALSYVALVLQIMGIDATVLLRLADAKLLRLRPCRLECAKLKRRTSELQQLQRLQCHLGLGGGGASGAAAAYTEIQATIQAAQLVVEAYASSSFFHLIRNSRRMEKDMSGMRRRVDACCALATVCIIRGGVAMAAAQN